MVEGDVAASGRGGGGAAALPRRSPRSCRGDCRRPARGASQPLTTQSLKRPTPEHTARRPQSLAALTVGNGPQMAAACSTLQAKLLALLPAEGSGSAGPDRFVSGLLKPSIADLALAYQLEFLRIIRCAAAAASKLECLEAAMHIDCPSFWQAVRPAWYC